MRNLPQNTEGVGRDGLTAEHESSRKPFGTRKVWRGCSTTEYTEGFSCPPEAVWVFFRVQPRRAYPKAQCPSVSVEDGFSVFSGKDPRRWEIYHRRHRSGLSADTESTEGVGRDGLTAEHESSRKPFGTRKMWRRISFVYHAMDGL